MNVVGLYVQAAQLVLDMDIDDCLPTNKTPNERLAEIKHMLPKLRSLLSCHFCNRLLDDPYGSPNIPNERFACESCVPLLEASQITTMATSFIMRKQRQQQRSKYLLPPRSYTINPMVRQLLRCYKSLCKHILNSRLFSQLQSATITKKSKKKKMNRPFNLDEDLKSCDIPLQDLVLEGASCSDVPLMAPPPPTLGRVQHKKTRRKFSCTSVKAKANVINRAIEKSPAQTFLNWSQTTAAVEEKSPTNSLTAFPMRNSTTSSGGYKSPTLPLTPQCSTSPSVHISMTTQICCEKPFKSSMTQTSPLTATPPASSPSVKEECMTPTSTSPVELMTRNVRKPELLPVASPESKISDNWPRIPLRVAPEQRNAGATLSMQKEPMEQHNEEGTSSVPTIQIQQHNEKSTFPVPKPQIQQPNEEGKLAVPKAQIQQPNEEDKLAVPKVQIQQPNEEDKLAVPKVQIQQPNEEEKLAVPKAQIQQPNEEDKLAVPKVQTQQHNKNTTTTQDSLVNKITIRRTSSMLESGIANSNKRQSYIFSCNDGKSPPNKAIEICSGNFYPTSASLATTAPTNAFQRRLSTAAYRPVVVPMSTSMTTTTAPMSIATARGKVYSMNKQRRAAQARANERKLSTSSSNSLASGFVSQVQTRTIIPANTFQNLVPTPPTSTSTTTNEVERSVYEVYYKDDKIITERKISISNIPGIGMSEERKLSKSSDEVLQNKGDEELVEDKAMIENHESPTTCQVTSTLKNVIESQDKIITTTIETAAASVEATQPTTNVISKFPVQTHSQNVASTKNPRRCRCGKATNNPGKLTCRGQRCLCYSTLRPCTGCKCRGCQNPHKEDGSIQHQYDGLLMLGLSGNIDSNKYDENFLTMHNQLLEQEQQDMLNLLSMQATEENAAETEITDEQGQVSQDLPSLLRQPNLTVVVSNVQQQQQQQQQQQEPEIQQELETEQQLQLEQQHQQLQQTSLSPFIIQATQATMLKTNLDMRNYEKIFIPNALLSQEEQQLSQKQQQLLWEQQQQQQQQILLQDQQQQQQQIMLHEQQMLQETQQKLQLSQEQHKRQKLLRKQKQKQKLLQKQQLKEKQQILLDHIQKQQKKQMLVEQQKLLQKQIQQQQEQKQQQLLQEQKQQQQQRLQKQIQKQQQLLQQQQQQQQILQQQQQQILKEQQQQLWQEQQQQQELLQEQQQELLQEQIQVLQQQQKSQEQQQKERQEALQKHIAMLSNSLQQQGRKTSTITSFVQQTQQQEVQQLPILSPNILPLKNFTNDAILFPDNMEKCVFKIMPSPKLITGVETKQQQQQLLLNNNQQLQYQQCIFSNNNNDVPLNNNNNIANNNSNMQFNNKNSNNNFEIIVSENTCGSLVNVPTILNNSLAISAIAPTNSNFQHISMQQQQQQQQQIQQQSLTTSLPLTAIEQQSIQLPQVTSEFTATLPMSLQQQLKQNIITLHPIMANVEGRTSCVNETSFTTTTTTTTAAQQSMSTFTPATIELHSPQSVVGGIAADQATIAVSPIVSSTVVKTNHNNNIHHHKINNYMMQQQQSLPTTLQMYIPATSSMTPPTFLKDFNITQMKTGVGTTTLQQHHILEQQQQQLPHLTEINIMPSTINMSQTTTTTTGTGTGTTMPTFLFNTNTNISPNNNTATNHNYNTSSNSNNQMNTNNAQNIQNLQTLFQILKSNKYS